MNKAIIDLACDNLKLGEVSLSPKKRKKKLHFSLSLHVLKFIHPFIYLIFQVLCLGLVGQDCKTVHVVKTGDSCPTIASQANITDGQLLIDNPNVNPNCTNIYVGEVIKVSLPPPSHQA